MNFNEAFHERSGVLGKALEVMPKPLVAMTQPLGTHSPMPAARQCLPLILLTKAANLGLDERRPFPQFQGCGLVLFGGSHAARSRCVPRPHLRNLQLRRPSSLGASCADASMATGFRTDLSCDRARTSGDGLCGAHRLAMAKPRRKLQLLERRRDALHEPICPSGRLDSLPGLRPLHRKLGTSRLSEARNPSPFRRSLPGTDAPLRPSRTTDLLWGASGSWADGTHQN